MIHWFIYHFAGAAAAPAGLHEAAVPFEESALSGTFGVFLSSGDPQVGSSTQFLSIWARLSRWSLLPLSHP